MEKIQVLNSCKQWFGEQGYTLAAEAKYPVDVVAQRGADHWLVSALGDRPDEKQYLYAFDEAIDRLIGANAELGYDVLMGVALPFSSTEDGQDLSYRRALKKYSNSIIFIDLNISLLLVRDDASLEVIAPDAANPFLRDLNRLIGRARRTS
jgi:hypothetical protein